MTGYDPLYVQETGDHFLRVSTAILIHMKGTTHLAGAPRFLGAPKFLYSSENGALDNLKGLPN